VPFAFVNNSSL